MTHPEKKVLGIFQAISVRNKRIFVKDIKGIDLYYAHCDPIHPLYVLDKGERAYLTIDGGETCKLEIACVECDFYGGSTKKPIFWP